ncbi:MAG: LacI family transcriptional regulator [Anaerolineae bacterium]|nr:LacI family transcriptional regulator [Anaerolineae bacterium]
METRTNKRPTIADVAQAAGVSLMTVSRVMNNKPGVGEELRQQIQALADEMGYRPSQIARGLVTRQSTMVGLVVPTVSNQFFAAIVRGAEDMAYENGYTMVLMNTTDDLDREIAALDSLWQNEITAVILCSSRLSPDDLEASITRFPAAVLINRVLSTPRPHIATLNVNDTLGAQLAVEHFIRSGRQRIAILAGPVYSISGHRRLDGYRAGLAAANIQFDPLLLEHSEPNFEGGYTAAAALLARRPKVEAIFAYNDLVAIGAMQACQEHGKSIPADIAVIGFDDLPLATIVRPTLSTLHVDLNALGRTAMRMALELIDSPGDTTAALQVDPELILREST